MTTLVTTEFDDLDDDGLKKAFAECFTITAAAVQRAAIILRVLEQREVDTADIEGPWFNLIRKVAYNTLLPEVAVKIVSDANTFKRIAALPLPDQQSVVDGKGLKVAVGQKPNGDIDYRLVRIEDMTQEQKNRVLGRGCIRTLEQQWQMLSSQPPVAEKLSIVSVELSFKRLSKLQQEAQKQKVSIAELIRRVLEQGGL